MVQENNWTKNKKTQIDFYLNSNEVIIVERKRCIKLLIDFIGYKFKEPKNLKILDFGCGNGAITKEINSVYPNNKYYLLDGSEEMLKRANEELKDIDIEIIESTFEEYLEKYLEEDKYDVIFSSMAIHHLDFINKSKLFSKFYHEMKVGGMFINIDTVNPPTEKLEKWQFQMWRDWMNETLVKNGFEDEVGKYDIMPDNFKSKSEDKPSELYHQLKELKKVGFRNVDVFYKYALFAVFGGMKN